MSKVKGDLCLSSTGETPKHSRISLPWTSPNSPSTPSPTSLTPWTQSLWIWLPANVHWDDMPLRGGGECQGSCHVRSYLLSRGFIIRAELTLSGQSRDSIPIPALFLFQT